MNVVLTAIPEVRVIEPKVFGDARGFFLEAYHAESRHELSVMSYLLAYRSRPSSPDAGFYVAARNDVLRRNGSDWRLARRLVQLDHVMLRDGVLSTLL